jgi:hypothetical protein
MGIPDGQPVCAACYAGYKGYGDRAGFAVAISYYPGTAERQIEQNGNRQDALVGRVLAALPRSPRPVPVALQATPRDNTWSLRMVPSGNAYGYCEWCRVEQLGRDGTYHLASYCVQVDGGNRVYVCAKHYDALRHEAVIRGVRVDLGA